MSTSRSPAPRKRTHRPAPRLEVGRHRLPALDRTNALSRGRESEHLDLDALVSQIMINTHPSDPQRWDPCVVALMRTVNAGSPGRGEVLQLGCEPVSSLVPGVPVRSNLGRRFGSVAGQVFVLQVAIVVLLAAGALLALVLQSRYDIDREARNRSVSVAQTFANSLGLQEALRSPDPSAILQPLAEETRKDAGVDFIVVMDTNGIRYSHPQPERIGERFVGTIEPSLMRPGVHRGRGGAARQGDPGDRPGHLARG